MNEETKWKKSYSSALVVILLVIALPGLLIPVKYRLVAWLLTLLLMMLFTLIVGIGLCGRCLGVFIDERNFVSLSRFQIVVWTLVVISAILVAFLSNISSGIDYPLKIVIPPELWILMGISVTSSVASPLIKNSQMEKDISKDIDKIGELKKLANQRGIIKGSKDTFSNMGVILFKKDLTQAHFIDIFKGEKLTDGGYLDFAKIQMFYFTIILVIAYGVAIGRMFLSEASAIGSLPPFDSAILALIGISHTGYLSNKAVTGPIKNK
jgi:hypothetical protein